MHVYTPPGYSPSKKYGVIYCYQGIGVGADTTFLDWSVYANVVADNLIGEGKIKPVIIVALDDQFDGNGSDVNGMTINDAIPYVDSHYSTYADADHRGVYGYSWGGQAAFCASPMTRAGSTMTIPARGIPRGFAVATWARAISTMT